MKSIKNHPRDAMIVGLVVTLLLLLLFGTSLIGSIIENGAEGLKEIRRSLFHWHDDPTGFFFSYLIGYAVIWWKPLWGSVVILIACILVMVINRDNAGFLIFALPPMAVSILYLRHWIDARKKTHKI
jgi:hypothetical protein